MFSCADKLMAALTMNMKRRYGKRSYVVKSIHQRPIAAL
jgi:hypothetical protein